MNASSKIKAALKRRQAQRQYDFNKATPDEPIRKITNEQKQSNDAVFDFIDRRQYGNDEYN
jgi:hypothetical protein